MSPSLVVLAEAGMVATSFVGNGILLACLCGCVALAWRQGFFFVTLLGMGLLMAFVSALAGASGLAEWMIELDLAPAHAPAAAFAAILAGGVIALGMALSQWIPEQAVWNGSLPGRLVGLAAGAVAGLLLAGGMLVAWSMAALPPALVLQPRHLAFDAGSFALQVAGRFVEPDRGRRDAILGGWQLFLSEGAGGRPACSEPFVDSNRNCARDIDERYLDIDGDGNFTLAVPEPGAGPPGRERWTPGWLDCYSMGSWTDVMASHPPRLTSPPAAEVQASLLDGGLYQALATDPDPCDRLTYAIKRTEADAEAEPALAIDAETGRVELNPAAAGDVQPVYEFTVTATDRSGLVSERPVRVKVRDPPALGDR
jgi:hypothetical protein